MASQSQLYVAIVGSGPAALYAAAELAKLDDPAVHVNLIDRLPTIGGLARSGVAPDHWDRRVVADIYERVARSSGRLRFFGNVDVGRDISHNDLLVHHHAVIYATGASRSRVLGIPGENLPGCHTASAYVGWYNGHPDHADLPVELNTERAVVIGNGNVALDIARLLLKPGRELERSDMSEPARIAFANSRVREVCVLARRGPGQAAFTNPELLELGSLQAVSVQVNPADLADEFWHEKGFSHSWRRDILSSFAQSRNTRSEKQLQLRFRASPVEVLGQKKVEGLKICRTRLVTSSDGRICAQPSDEYETLNTGLIVMATGYRCTPTVQMPYDEDLGSVPNDAGRVLDGPGGKHKAGSYVVGWLKRGPRGGIGSNKPCAKETVASLIQDFRQGKLAQPLSSISSFTSLVKAQQPHTTSYRGWKAIDRYERQHCNGIQPRHKLVRLTDLLRVASRLA